MAIPVLNPTFSGKLKWPDKHDLNGNPVLNPTFSGKLWWSDKHDINGNPVLNTTSLESESDNLDRNSNCCEKELITAKFSQLYVFLLPTVHSMNLAIISSIFS